MWLLIGSQFPPALSTPVKLGFFSTQCLCQRVRIDEIRENSDRGASLGVASLEIVLKEHRSYTPHVMRAPHKRLLEVCVIIAGCQLCEAFGDTLLFCARLSLSFLLPCSFLRLHACDVSLPGLYVSTFRDAELLSTSLSSLPLTTEFEFQNFAEVNVAESLQNV